MKRTLASALLLVLLAQGSADALEETITSDKNYANHYIRNLPAPTVATNPVRLGDTFTSSANGVVPLSGGGTANFLRADGTWAAPGGTGVTSVSGTSGRISSTGGTTPVLDLVTTAVTPASYTYGGFTVDAYGRLTAASSGATPALAARTLTGTSPVLIDGGTSGDLSANRTISIAANGIGNTLLRQGAALSVIGVAGNATANVADIPASGPLQFLSTNGAGTALAWTSTIAATSAPLTSTFVGYGSPGNLLTGSTGLTFTAATGILRNIGDATIGAPTLHLQRSLGSIASPSTVANTSDFASINFDAHDGTNYVNTIRIGAHATPSGTVATGSVPSDYYIIDTTTGVATDPYASTGVAANLLARGGRTGFGVNTLATFPTTFSNVFASAAVLWGFGAASTSAYNSANFGNTGFQISNPGQLVLMNNSATDSFTSRTWRFARSRGTNASPTAVAGGDTVGGIGFYGYDGANYLTRKTVKAFVNFDTTVSVGNVFMDWGVFNNDGTGLPDLFVGAEGDVIVGTWGGVGTGGYFRLGETNGVPTTTPAAIRISAIPGATSAAIPMLADTPDARIYAYFGHWAPVAQDTTAKATGLLKNTTTTGVWSIATAGTDYAPAGNYITALTGDGTASGPGSAVFTLATVGGGAGSCTYCSVTFDAKGRQTAYSSGATPALASRTLTAGAGMTGGGDWSANRTVDVVAGDATIVVHADDIVAGVMQTANIADDAVTYAKVQNVSAASRVLCRGSASGAGSVQECTAGTGLTISGTVISSTLVGLTDGDKGDITVSGTGATWTIDNDAVTTAKIADDAVTNAKAANMATARFKGRVTAGTGDPEDLTGAQATTLLDVFTSSLKGLAPASGGGTTTFLRADGTYAVPPGTGGGGTVTAVTASLPLTSSGGSAPNIALTYNSSLTLDGSNQLQVPAFTGDVTKAAGANVTTIAPQAVIYSKIQNLATDRLLGRDSAGAGSAEEIAVTSGIGFTGAGSIGLTSTGVTAASYTYGSFTVDAQGRLTAASSGATPALAARTLTMTSPLTIDGGSSADLSANRTIAIPVTSTQIPVGTGTSITSSSNLTFDSTALNATLVAKSSNATSAGLYFQDTVSSAQTVVFLDNNRGSFASYGGLLNGGSTNAIGNLFGVSRADRVFMFSDGASNAGLAVGTLNTTSLILGTNNIARVTVASGGGVTLSSLVTGLVKSTSGLLANASAADVASVLSMPCCSKVLAANTGATGFISSDEVRLDSSGDAFMISDDGAVTWRKLAGGVMVGATTYEQVRARFASGVFNIKSEIAGLGVSYPAIVVDAGTNYVNLSGGDVRVATLTGGGYVATDVGAGTGALINVTPTAELDYFFEVTTGTIGTLNGADQYISTSNNSTFYGSTAVEYPLAKTVPTYDRLEVCIVGTNTITGGAVDVSSRINGGNGAQVLLDSSSTGCTRASSIPGGAATATVGVQLFQHSVLGVRQTATLSGTLRLAIKLRFSPLSTF